MILDSWARLGLESCESPDCSARKESEGGNDECSEECNGHN